MYRVLIVDDEEPVLESYLFIFKKYVTDFEICGKARSGSEAVKLIKELNPDIVFMDIQMPGLNGIDAISKVRPLFPETFFILSTAYERFDIAQRAINLGVQSYLVKPVSKNKILDELDRVKTILDNRINQNSTQEIDDSFYEIKKEEYLFDFITNLRWNNPDKESWDNLCKYFSFNSDKALISIIGLPENRSEIIRTDTFRHVTKNIEYKYNCLSTITGKKLVLLFPEQRSIERVEVKLSGLASEYSENSSILGIGKLELFNELKKSYLKALEPFEGSKNNLQIKEAYDKILSLDKNEAVDYFQEYWTSIFDTYSFEVSKGKMVSLFTMLIQNVDKQLLEQQHFESDISEIIIPIKDIEEWQKWSSKYFLTVFELIDLQKTTSYPKTLRFAMDYVHNNYKNQLQLSQLADECMVSASHLSRLFSEHLNIKFIDYLNKYRIDEAVILLRDKNRTIKEAAYLVGFQDPNYFSRIFRRYMGTSPSEIVKGI